MHIFAVGQRVRIVGHWEFTDGIVGTISLPEAFQLDLAEVGEWQGHRRIVRGPHGSIVFYYVRFDQPADDGSGDGPYAGAEIEGKCLAPVFT